MVARCQVEPTPESEGRRAIVATGRLDAFRAAYASLDAADDAVTLDPDSAAALRVAPGDTVVHIPR